MRFHIDKSRRVFISGIVALALLGRYGYVKANEAISKISKISDIYVPRKKFALVSPVSNWLKYISQRGSQLMLQSMNTKQLNSDIRLRSVLIRKTVAAELPMLRDLYYMSGKRQAQVEDNYHAV